MKTFLTLFSLEKLIKESLKISKYFLIIFIFIVGSNYCSLTQKTLFAQISTQKISPVKPAEQPKQFQTQPKPQFQVSPSIKVIYPNGGGRSGKKGKLIRSGGVAKIFRAMFKYSSCGQ
ncbi:MAG: hypothetical protein ACUVT6_12660 [Thermodesulfobacteriota bacterium]